MTASSAATAILAFLNGRDLPALPLRRSGLSGEAEGLIRAYFHRAHPAAAAYRSDNHVGTERGLFGSRPGPELRTRVEATLAGRGRSLLVRQHVPEGGLQ